MTTAMSRNQKIQVFKDIKVPLDEELSEHLAWLMPEHGDYRILKKSLDSRTRHNPHQVYTVEVAASGEKLPEIQIDVKKVNYQGPKPIIIGAGPAGLFAALRFVESGVPCMLFERGSAAEKRILGINKFWRYGEFDPRNNVCYGEGGAGLYSDGKLITRIKSPHIPYVMNRLVKFGAPAEIEYLSNPHVGSDRIRRVIPKMRDFLVKNGCQIFYDTQITEILCNGDTVVGVRTEHDQVFDSDKIILATGHSAEDMITELQKKDVKIEGKSFAMGLRIEHPQKMINKIQYREFAEHPKLGSANYKLTFHNDKTNEGVYSFCMCPGGYVLSSGTEPDRIVCNGMSNYNRNSPFANSAIVVTIDHDKNFGADVFGGMKLREQLEKQTFKAVQNSSGTHQIPVQTLMDFLIGKKGNVLPSSSPSGVAAINFKELLPGFMYRNLITGVESFNQKMKGFLSDQAQFHGIESRTSSPVRVTRDAETLESVSHKGLYPCGEGAGYAGGITSAAVDGIKIVDKILN
jgi:uncharacterized FAD-dependent dehydrogenase